MTTTGWIYIYKEGKHQRYRINIFGQVYVEGCGVNLSTKKKEEEGGNIFLTWT